VYFKKLLGLFNRYFSDGHDLNRHFVAPVLFVFKELDSLMLLLFNSLSQLHIQSLHVNQIFCLCAL
jgi:hypothetical protein